MVCTPSKIRAPATPPVTPPVPPPAPPPVPPHVQLELLRSADPWGMPEMAMLAAIMRSARNRIDDDTWRGLVLQANHVNRLIDDLHAARERLLIRCGIHLLPNADTNDDADVIDLTD